MGTEKRAALPTEQTAKKAKKEAVLKDEVEKKVHKEKKDASSKKDKDEAEPKAKKKETKEKKDKKEETVEDASSKKKKVEKEKKQKQEKKDDKGETAEDAPPVYYLECTSTGTLQLGGKTFQTYHELMQDLHRRRQAEPSAKFTTRLTVSHEEFRAVVEMRQSQERERKEMLTRLATEMSTEPVADKKLERQQSLLHHFPAPPQIATVKLLTDPHTSPPSTTEIEAPPVMLPASWSSGSTALPAISQVASAEAASDDHQLPEWWGLEKPGDCEQDNFDDELSPAAKVPVVQNDGSLVSDVHTDAQTPGGHALGAAVHGEQGVVESIPKIEKPASDADAVFAVVDSCPETQKQSADAHAVSCPETQKQVEVVDSCLETQKQFDTVPETQIDPSQEPDVHQDAGISEQGPTLESQILGDLFGCNHEMLSLIEGHALFQEHHT